MKKKVGKEKGVCIHFLNENIFVFKSGIKKLMEVRKFSIGCL